MTALRAMTPAGARHDEMTNTPRHAAHAASSPAPAAVIASSRNAFELVRPRAAAAPLQQSLGKKSRLHSSGAVLVRDVNGRLAGTLAPRKFAGPLVGGTTPMQRQQAAAKTARIGRAGI